MSAYLSALAKRYPSVAAFEKAVTKPKGSVEDLRTTLWNTRFQYYYRRLASAPEVLKQAQADAPAIAHKWMNPSAWTFGDAATVFVQGVQILGAFAIGESIARGSIVGYNVGHAHAENVNEATH